MNNKKYEDYHVLDEETDNLDLEQENEQTNKLSKLVEIEPEINTIDTYPEQSVGKQEIEQSEVIDVEVIDQDQTKSSYTSVLQDVEDEEILSNTMTHIDEYQEQQASAVNECAQVVIYQPILTEEDDEEQEIEDRFQSSYKQGKEESNYTNQYSENIYDSYENNYKESTYQQNDYSKETQPFNNQELRDTSFSSYIAADKKRERSFLVKWGTRLAKLILFMMLLPVIGVVGGGALFIVGGITLGILACIGGGLFILGSTCFIATQVNTTIIALGISTGITAISFGGIVLVLCMMFIKKMNQLIHQHKANKKNKEVR